MSGRNSTDQYIRVKPAPRGKKPSWGGFVPQHLGRELCQKMRAIIVGDEPLPYLEPAAATTLEHTREDLGPILRDEPLPIQEDEQRLRWWTFAGGRINHTFKYALEWLNDWKVVADNVLLRVEGKGANEGNLRAAIARMSEPGFWSADETRAALLARVPEYRLSKFQVALPTWAAAEMVGAYLLDFGGAEAVGTHGGGGAA